MTTPTAATRKRAPQAERPAVDSSPFMTAHEVSTLIRIAMSTLHAWVAAGRFPAPVNFGLRSNGRACVAAWVRAEVEAWIEEQIAKPRTVGRKAEQVA